MSFEVPTLDNEALNQLPLTGDPGDEVPEELLTDEEKADRQRLVDEAAAKVEADKVAEREALLDKVKGIVGVFEDAPARQAPVQQQAPPELPPQPTAEQITAWNDQLRELQVTDPLRYAAMMREGAIEEAQRRIMAGAGPLLDSAGEGFIERFKSSKAATPFAKQIETLFEAEMADLTPRQLLQMTPEQRSLEMTRRWKAATGDFYEKNAKPVQHLPTSGSRGTSVAPSSGNRSRPKVTELSDGEKIALVRALGKDKALKEIAAIEYGV